MWVKRSEAEMVEQRKRKSRDRVWYSVFVAVLLTAIGTCLVGWKEGSRRGGLFFVPADELISRLPLSFTFGVAAALVSYKWGWRKPPVSLICPKCEAAKLDDGQNQCACGCSLEKMDEMKWVP